MAGEQQQSDRDQKDLALGRAIREKREAEAKVSRLEAKAKGAGNLLVRLGSILQSSPQHTHFEAASTNVKMIPANTEIFKQNEIDGKQIAQLTNELRDAIEELERVKKRVQPYGV
jgi:prefoldin subunit 5